MRRARGPLGKWEAVNQLLEAAFTRDGYTERLVEPVRESVGTYMGEAVLAQESGQKWISPRWEALIGAVKESEVTGALARAGRG